MEEKKTKRIDDIRAKIAKIAMTAPRACECGLSVDDALHLLFLVDFWQAEAEEAQKRQGGNK